MSIMSWQHVRIVATPTADAVVGAATALSALHRKGIHASALLATAVPDEPHTHYLLIGDLAAPEGKEVITAPGQDASAALFGVETTTAPLNLIEACLALRRHGMALGLALGDRGCLESAKDALRETRATLSKALAWAQAHPSRRGERHVIVEVGNRVPPALLPRLTTSLAKTIDGMAVALCRDDLGTSRLCIAGDLTEGSQLLDGCIAAPLHHDEGATWTALPAQQTEDAIEKLHLLLEKALLEETV